MSTDVRTIIAQHAKTAQLLGVDFLPLGTPPNIADEYQNDGPEESSRTRSEPTQQSQAQPQTNRPANPSPASPKPMSAQDIRSAYEHLDSPQAQLEALKAKYELDAPHQQFNTTFTNIVFGEGDPDASLMFIGEAPGEQEDQTGRPFVGRAGQLLENMIKAMGLTRESVYIANVLKVRPPNNATPTAIETRLSSPYLAEQIRIINPSVIVTLGLPATHFLLGTTGSMRSLRGRWHPLGSELCAIGVPEIQIMPTYHPAYLLRAYTEDNRRKVWSDLTMVMDRLGLSRAK
ncbi:MAG: uracil-DNA glycosylase family protein [Phycisphaerales bacterium]